MSKIEWTNETWNPLIGCTKTSAGCKNCYAIKTAWIRMHNPLMADRYAGTVGKTAGRQLNWTGRVNIVREAMEKPLKIKKPTMFFVTSMSDLFHPSVNFQFIVELFHIMKRCPQHSFQILTKQSGRMREFMNEWAPNPYGHPYEPLPNVWLGVSVEHQETDCRILDLLSIRAAVRFLSCEPLLGPLDLQYPKTIWPTGPQMCCSGKDCGCMGMPSEPPLIHGINWVIAGGESGPGARPMHRDWVRSLRDQCQSARIPFFFKQWGEWVAEGQKSNFIAGSKVREVKNLLPDGTEYITGVIDPGDISCMLRVGKHLAGRQLDGRTWDEMPI